MAGMEKTVNELAAYLGGVVVGDGTCMIRGLAPLEHASHDTATFLANPKYASKVAATKAGVVLMARVGKRMVGPLSSSTIPILALQSS